MNSACAALLLCLATQSRQADIWRWSEAEGSGAESVLHHQISDLFSDSWQLQLNQRVEQEKKAVEEERKVVEEEKKQAELVRGVQQLAKLAAVVLPNHFQSSPTQHLRHLFTEFLSALSEWGANIISFLAR